MLRCSRVTVSYGAGENSVQVLGAVDWESISPVTAIIGPSGSGKSTFLRVLSGLQAPSAGSVQLDGKPVRPRGRGLVDPRIGVVYQDLRLVDFLTVEQNLRLAADLRGVPVTDDGVRSALASVGVHPLLHRLPAQISGGEQQRVAIARAILTRSRAVLADEPTGSLDGENTRHVAEVLVRLGREEEVAVVIATHDPLVADMADDVFRLEQGALRRVR